MREAHSPVDDRNVQHSVLDSTFGDCEKVLQADLFLNRKLLISSAAVGRKRLLFAVLAAKSFHKISMFPPQPN